MRGFVLRPGRDSVDRPTAFQTPARPRHGAVSA